MAQKAKTRLEELTSKAKLITKDVLAACDVGSDEIKLAAAVREAQALEACLSAYIADLKKWMSKPENEGSCFFKVYNVPQWPAARLKAWLTRNKLAVMVCISDSHQNSALSQARLRRPGRSKAIDSIIDLHVFPAVDCMASVLDSHTLLPDTTQRAEQHKS
jgi:hypothetical protein